MKMWFTAVWTVLMSIKFQEITFPAFYMLLFLGRSHHTIAVQGVNVPNKTDDISLTWFGVNVIFPSFTPSAF